MFNEIFRDFMEKSMNRFPLRFGFEGAFYGAWYITKKNYLGYKLEGDKTCKIVDGKIVPIFTINS